jgi:hypothetical protein
MKNKGGRPTKYTPELAAEICKVISSNSRSLVSLCKENPHWPDRSKIYEWLHKFTEFRDCYAQAKRQQIEALVDDILQISDDKSEDYIVGDDGMTFNATAIQRARLMVDTRKWFASKLAPKIYGDKVQHEGTVGIKHSDALKELE